MSSDRETCNHCYRKNHFERCCQNMYRWNTDHGQSMNHLTASSSICKFEFNSDDEIVAIQALFPEVSDNQKVFVEKNDNKDNLQVISYSSRSLNTTEQRESESILVLFMHVSVTELIYLVEHLRYMVTIKHSLIY